MGCFRSRSKSTPSPMKSSSAFPSNPESRTLKQEVLLTIPACIVHLMDEGEAVELARGEFTLVRIVDENVSLATIIKVGDDLQWPLTKDEPVVKLDFLHYLFSLPMKDGDPLSYGVTFLEAYSSSLGLLDSFLREHSCFSGSASTRKNDIDWKEFAPRIDNYNNFLAKAIAGGTGQIIKGIFKCSNAYTNQVHKGGEMILTQAAGEKNWVTARESNNNTSNGARKKSGVNKNLKRVKKLSKMTEKLSKSMLDVVGVAAGSVMTPLVKSQAGKAFLSMVPGEVLLASLDAVNKVLDAAEAAEKQALSATSKAATRAVSERFGENAGEATGHVLETAGHCACAAWNIFKIRKALTPTSAVSNGALVTAERMRNVKY
ncbi:Senescence/dehydration-associated protein [Melia azedarach]|uniref:Senescence/dehydration-associated protein n=1 Tax=Melia azedarach TaxID=155640 RepID=A0ACC1XAV9_MELAZ|nr:Senescence/dehydration-associated protein [Melia azedarach]